MTIPDQTLVFGKQGATVLPVAAPYTSPVGRVIPGGSPPTTYNVSWWQGPGDPLNIITPASQIVGLGGAASEALLTANPTAKFFGKVPTTSITQSAPTSPIQQWVGATTQLYVTIMGASGDPAGTVTFSAISGGTTIVLGSAPVLTLAPGTSAASFVANGSMFTLPPTVTYTIRAHYSGDDIYLGGDATPDQSLTVTPFSG